MTENEKLSEQIIDLLSQLQDICGSSIIKDIINDNRNDLKSMYKLLYKYFSNVYIEIVQDSEENQENKSYFSFIQLNDIILDKYISRIERMQKYDYKKKKLIYCIKIYKKYTTPEETSFLIEFETEHERERGIDILKGKLNQMKLNIL